MTNRSEIRPFARLFESRRALYKAGARALDEIADWPKIVVSPLFQLSENEDLRRAECFAPAEFADDMAAHGILALPYDKFVVIMGPCDARHWIVTVERRDDLLIGRSWVIGRDYACNGAGVLSFRIGSNRDEWIDGPDGLVIDDEAKSEKLERDIFTEKFIWISSVFQCVGLLASKGVTSESVSAPMSINKRREQKNLDPIFSYRLLTINVQEASEARREVCGTHASPRLHWRRGHVRKLADGRHTIVRPCLVGSIERGYVAKDYKVKMSENA